MKIFISNDFILIITMSAIEFVLIGKNFYCLRTLGGVGSTGFFIFLCFCSVFVSAFLFDAGTSISIALA